MFDSQRHKVAMRHNLVNDVNATSGVSSNDLMIILDDVFLFGPPCINLSLLRILL